MTVTITELETRLRAQGYEPRRPELIALAGALSAPAGAGARALLLEGPPGCGKSQLAEATAQMLGATFLACQMHAWTDSDELFVGVDVASAVAGDAERVRQPGILARAAETSEQGLTILLLDEVDKTSERAEALLLDWLQSGRVPVQPGVHLRTRLENLLVIITSNGVRELSEALLRRVRRVRMSPLSVAVSERLIQERTRAPQGVVRLAWKAAREVAEAERTVVSLQEGVRLVHELAVCRELGDARESLAGWAAKTDAGAHHVRKMDLAPLWGEVAKAKREGWR